jgi:hypothetical protein
VKTALAHVIVVVIVVVVVVVVARFRQASQLAVPATDVGVEYLRKDCARQDEAGSQGSRIAFASDGRPWLRSDD